NRRRCPPRCSTARTSYGPLMATARFYATALGVRLEPSLPSTHRGAVRSTPPRVHERLVLAVLGVKCTEVCGRVRDIPRQKVRSSGCSSTDPATHGLTHAAGAETTCGGPSRWSRTASAY